MPLDFSKLAPASVRDQLTADALEAAELELQLPDDVDRGPSREYGASDELDELVPAVSVAGNRPGKVRRDHRATARVAAELVLPRSGTQRARVLLAIAAAAGDGLTDEEGATLLDMSPNTWRPRRVELVEHGWVEPSPLTRITELGRDATVWTLTEAGWSWWNGEPARTKAAA